MIKPRTSHKLMASPPPTIRSSFSFFSLHLLLSFLLLLLSPPIGALQNQFELDGKVLELDYSNFDAAISKFDCILVDFYAPWCGHCKRLAPELAKAAPILAGQKQPIVVAKVDADKHRELASKHHIHGYPTLKIFVRGVPTDYYGPRKADLLVRTLTKFVAPDVAVLNSDSAIRDFVEAAGSDFPIFVGFGLNESIVLNVAVKYKKKARFSVAKDLSDDIMTVYDFNKVPALAVIHPAYSEHSIFYGPFEEKLLEGYINQSLLPLVLPISQYSLKSLKDDDRKVVLTILEDETEERTKGLVKVVQAAASVNRDLIFGYVGFKQWEDFTKLFEVSKKSKLPKMVVWDGNVDYYWVIGSESIDERDMGRQVSAFLKGYRDGDVIHKRIRGATFIGFIRLKLVFILIFVVVVVLLLLVVLILTMTKEEPLTVGTRTRDREVKSCNLPETRELLRPAVKED